MKNIIVDPANVDSSASFISASAARDGSLLVAYIPPAHKGAFSVDMSVLKTAKFAYWFDPTDGRYILVEAPAISTKGVRKFVPPSKNNVGESDWVLVLTTKKIQ